VGLGLVDIHCICHALTVAWNGRLLFQGGGGTNGELGFATGALQPGMPTGLEQGLAVVSTDTGHDNASNTDAAKQGTVAFGHDYEARLEYSQNALDSVATTAKRIVRGFYGRPARHNYFAGCSNGGREGMVFAQRYPDQFDGIVAAAPAFAVPKAAIAEAWDTQTFAALAAREGFTQKNGLPDLARALSDSDLALVAAAIFGTSEQFPRSGWDLVGAQSTDLARFRKHGGKLIVPHGGSDPIFSINDTLAWWRRLDAVNHGQAASFLRVFPVPGMNHCTGGPATDQFDALTAVVDWVEQGRAPDRIEARAGPLTPWPGRSRPLCAYPQIARYRSGDLNQAASFVCEAEKQ
jgi:pimeloyl-ACP methyl ester carboxylesterase